MSVMAGDCLKCFVILLAIEFGASDEIIQRTYQYEDQVDFACDNVRLGRINYAFSKTDPTFQQDSCDVTVQGSVVKTFRCPFNNAHMEGSVEDHILSIKEFNPGHHSGYWRCVKHNAPVYNVIGYSFHDSVTITPNQNGHDLHLECRIKNIFPLICETQSKQCQMSENDTLTWYYNGKMIHESQSLSQFINEIGLYTAKKTLVLENKNITTLEAGDDYTCVYKNFLNMTSSTSFPENIKKAFRLITHKITKIEIGGETTLECQLDHHYPSICKSKSRAECLNSANHLTWYMKRGDTRQYVHHESLVLEDDAQYEGLYQARSTVTQKFKDFQYLCVYQNLLGNKSTAFYPHPTVEKFIQHGDEFDLKCPSGGLSYYAKNLQEPETCHISIDNSTVVTHECPFPSESMEWQASQGSIKIRKFDAPKHSGFWVCTSNDPIPIDHLSGYAYKTIDHKIFAKEIGWDVHLLCVLDHFYPSICESENEARCVNNTPVNHLKWFKDTGDVSVELVADSSITRQDSQYEGFYKSRTTTILKDTKLQHLEDFKIRCVYENTQSKKSTAIYPHRTVTKHTHHEDEIELKLECPSGDVSYYAKSPQKPKTCHITIKNEIVVTHECPFTNKSMTANATEGSIKIRKFEAPKHSGYWVCASDPANIYNLVGYAFITAAISVTQEKIGNHVRLTCLLQNHYPSIKTQTWATNWNSQGDSLRWLRDCYGSDMIEYVPDTLTSTNNSLGLYTANSTLVLKEMTLDEIEKNNYSCVYENWLGNTTAYSIPATETNENISTGHNFSIICPPCDQQRFQVSFLDKNEKSSQCVISIHGADVSTKKCPFTEESLIGEAKTGNLTVKFNPLVHSGRWRCITEQSNELCVESIGNISGNQSSVKPKGIVAVEPIGVAVGVGVGIILVIIAIIIVIIYVIKNKQQQNEVNGEDCVDENNMKKDLEDNLDEDDTKDVKDNLDDEQTKDVKDNLDDEQTKDVEDHSDKDQSKNVVV